MKLIGIAFALAGIQMSYFSIKGMGPNWWWTYPFYNCLVQITIPLLLVGIGWELFKCRGARMTGRMGFPISPQIQEKEEQQAAKSE